MRLFVAVTPPPEALQALRAALAPVTRQWDGLRWARQESWHITLAFLGEVDAARIPDLTARLGRAAARHPAMDLAIGGAGAFSRPAAARVVWAGVTGAREELRRLADSVAAAARRSGIPVEDRRFRPHLTLARSNQGADVRPLITELGDLAGPVWTADAIHLIRSHLGPNPRYEELHSWPLRSRN